MSSKLREAKTSVRTTTSINEEKKEVPAGAEIISSDVRTETEEIENGWLVTKNYDVRYKLKNSDHTEYAYYNKKWYSEENPIKVEVTDKSLAEAFESE